MKRRFGEFRTSTSAVACNFSEDIIIEILLRLPANSLMRFKCVAKRWQSLISDPGFVKSHLQMLKAGDIISSQRIFKTTPLETINYEALDGGDDRAVVKYHQPIMGVDVSSCDPKLVGSCDGLVCLSVHDRFVLYNPTTKESRNLPGSDLFQIDELIQGLGYDSRSDDYKIVQRKVPENWQEDSGESEVVIFSLKSGSWRRTQARLGRQLSLGEAETGQGVYWNGALHWCAIDYSKEMAEIVIISFDLSEEKFQHVLSVPKVNGDIRFWELGIHGTNLLMFSVYSDSFQAWTMSEYEKGGSWTKLSSVSTEGILDYNYWEKLPVTHTRSGKIVFQLSVDEMILFNPEDNTYKDYPIKKGGHIDSIIYVETLVSPYLACEPSRI